MIPLSGLLFAQSMRPIIVWSLCHTVTPFSKIPLIVWRNVSGIVDLEMFISAIFQYVKCSMHRKSPGGTTGEFIAYP